MSTHTVKQCFQLLDQSTSFIAREWSKSYLEALIDTAENLFRAELVVDATPEQASALHKMYEAHHGKKYSKEEKRSAFQLAVLKGLKEQPIPGVSITPDSVSVLISFLAKELIPFPSTILDPAVGSGNLISAVMNQYDHPLSGWGTEIDATMIRLAYVNASWQGHDLELIHQDALKPQSISPVPLLVCDLPMGVSPDQAYAKRYELYNEEQDVYTHQLLIEQSIQSCAQGGYLLFLIPNSLFVETGADRLRKWVTDQTYIQAIIQLPQQLFQQEDHQKSIFILQKKGDDIKRPKQTLMASLPSFDQPRALQQVMDQIKEWILTEKG